MVLQPVMPSSLMRCAARAQATSTLPVNSGLESSVRENSWMVDIEGRRVFVYIFDEENYPVIYGFDSKVPVYIWGGQCEIDFSEVYNYIRFLIES